jgi:hypothetical protein
MGVVLQYDVGVQRDPIMILEELQRIQNYLGQCSVAKQGDPFNDGNRDEMRRFWIDKAIATSGHDILLSALLLCVSA